VIKTDNNRKFCFFETINKYNEFNINVLLSNEDLKNGVIILPNNGININLKDGPIFDLIFSQGLVKLNGEIKDCINCKNTKILLEKIFDNNKIEKNVNQDLKFEFIDLIPGKLYNNIGEYKISIINNFDYCWEFKTKNLILNSDTNITFKQKGVQLTIISSHNNINLNIFTLKNNFINNFNLNQGNILFFI
jgi:hypothetical protein